MKNRTIKFRVWDVESSDMIQHKDLIMGDVYMQVSEDGMRVVMDDPEGENGPEVRDAVIMQYIGLKDKHGKEIYESDVILHERQSRPYSSKAKTAIVKCIVQWMDGKTYGDNIENPSSFNQNPCFIAKPIGDHESTKWGYDWSEFHDCEVIGNIYENPELCQ